MVKLIAELGINHLGDINKALRMIKNLSNTDVPSIKFQFRDSLDFFTEHVEMGSTLVRQELDGANASFDDTLKLCEYAKSKDLEVGVSFFRIKDMNSFCEHFTPDFIKIPSAEANNYKLITKAQTYVDNVIVSTGGLEFEGLIDLAKNIKFRTTDCVMHCISNYPASVNLIKPEYILQMKNIFGCEVGYSSHDAMWEANLLFLPMGVEILERHYCESKSDIGLDITTSSTLNELVKLNTFCTCRDWSAENSLSNKVINQGEIQNIKDLGSGYYFDKEYELNDKVRIEDLLIMSPCRGLKVGSIDDFVTLQKAKKHDAVNQFHLNKSRNDFLCNVELMNKKSVSLPIRTHDVLEIDKTFGLKNYEWHLSYQECTTIRENYITKFRPRLLNKQYSLHLPDYINSSSLIDPFSGNDLTKNSSIYLLDECCRFAADLQNETGLAVPIVGSFSVMGSDKSYFYRNLSELINSYYDKFQVKIMPQFLPKIAWYFGGSVKLDVFCSLNDISYFNKLPHGICLDTAHCIMAANYENQCGNDWILKLLHLAGHLHISDALGVDGEGVKFGSGELNFSTTQIMNANNVKVIEQWEGHLNSFSGFQDALKYIELNA